MFIRDIIDAHSYFSVWSLYFLMIIIWRGCEDPIVHSRCLFYLVISCCGGTHIAYIYPKRLHVQYLRYEFHGLSLKLLDFWGHYLPLFYYLSFHFIPYRCLTLSDIVSIDHLWLPIVYLLLGRSYELYGLRYSDMINVVTTSIMCTYIIQILHLIF